MEKTINIDFDNSTTILGGYDPDILGAGSTKYALYGHDHGALSLVNLTGTSLSNGLTLIAADPSAAANAVYAGDYISLSTQGASTTISVTGLQSSGPYLTTAAHSTHNHGEAPSVTGQIGGTLGSSGWSLSIPDFLISAALTDHTHSQYLPIGNSTAYASSVLVNTFLTTAARSTHIHGLASGTNITIGSSSNGLALSVRAGLGTNTSVGTVTGSVPGMTGNTSGLTVLIPAALGGSGGLNVTLGGNSSSLGAGFILMSSGTLSLAGGSNITLSQDGYHVTIVGAAAGTGGAGTGYSSASVVGSNIAGTLDSNGLSLSIPNYLTTAMLSDNTSLFEYTSHTSAITANAINTSQSGLFQHTSATSAITSNAVNTNVTSQWLTTAMQSNYTSVFQYVSNTSAITSNAMNTNAASNFIGTNTSIQGANMTANSSGITISVPMATATAANAVLAGDYISISTNGANTTVSAINLQPTASMSNYQLVANSTLSLGTGATQSFLHTSNSSLLVAVSNSSLSLGTAATQSFVHTSNSSLFQAVSNSSLSIPTNQSSLFQHTSVNSYSLGTIYTSHTHSNLYIALSASTAYQTSVLSNTFAVTDHTHAGTGVGTGFSSTSTGGSNIVGTLGISGLNLGVPNYLTTAMLSNGGSNFIGTNTSIQGANMTANSSGITISVPMATATAANAVHAGSYISISTNGANTTVNAIPGNIHFGDANGASFGSSVNGISTTITASLVTNYASSSHTHGNVSLSLSNISGTYSSASNGLTLSLTGNTLGGGTGGVALQDSVNSITGGTAYLSNLNGISFGINGSTITAQHNAYSTSSQLTATFAHTSHTHSNLYIALSASTAYQTSVLDDTFAVTSHTHSYPYTEGSVYFVTNSGSNITWGSAVSGVSTSIFATAGGGTGGGGGYPIVISGNTLGTTASISSGTMTLAGGNNITLSQNGNRVSIIGGNHGNVYFADTNGISFGSSTNGVSTTISGSVATNYAASTHTHSQYLTTAASVSHTHGNISLSLVNISGTYASASNGMTLSLTGNTGGAGGGIAGLGFRNSGTISSNAFTSGSVMLSGINLTVSTSSNGASQYLNIQGPAIGYLFFSNTNGHSWSSSVIGMSTSVYIIT